MQIPLELTTRNVRRTPDLEETVERRVDKLERICDHIIGCRVAIERPHEHPSSGSPYRIRIDLTVPPRHELVVTKDPRDHDLGEELKTVLIDAFEAAERQLEELVERQRREVKKPEEPRALVARLFPDEGYGFLETVEEGRDIYFHENAVAGDAFDRLAVGTEVRFTESMGHKGPQASTVQIVNKPGEGPEEDLDASPPGGRFSDEGS